MWRTCIKYTGYIFLYCCCFDCAVILLLLFLCSSISCEKNQQYKTFCFAFKRRWLIISSGRSVFDWLKISANRMIFWCFFLNMQIVLGLSPNWLTNVISYKYAIYPLLFVRSFNALNETKSTNDPTTYIDFNKWLTPLCL